MSDGDSISANIASVLIWLKAYGSDAAVATMTTSEAAGGRQVYYYIKFCPVDPTGCRCGPWNKDRWRHTKEEAVAKFRDHLYDKHRIVSDQLMQTFCDALEFETYNDPAGVEEPPEPATPPPVMTPKPKQLALPPPSVKNEPAENASSSSKRRKVETPDKAPALKSEGDDTVEIRNDVVLAINAADEPADEPPAPEPDEDTIEIGPDVMAALMHAMRLFAVTMDDAVATLGEAATTMSNFLKGQFK